MDKYVPYTSPILTEFVRKALIVARYEQLGLFDPLIAGDAPFETAKCGINAGDIFIAPRSDLRESGDPLFGKDGHQLGAKPLDLAQIVG